MRIVVVGAGVIGSIYGDRLARSGHDVMLLARGRRLADLRAHGLVLEDASSGQRTQISLPVLDELSGGDRYDLALVPVRAEQLVSTLPILLKLDEQYKRPLFWQYDRPPNRADGSGRRTSAFRLPRGRWCPRRRAHQVRHYPKAENHARRIGWDLDPRIGRLQTMFTDAGFPTNISTDIKGWMLGHSAFIVPIGFALYRFGSDPTALAADASTLRLMVRATREAFEALDDVEIPANLRWLYLRMPTGFAVHYWRRVFASPRGELWFGAHSRAAPDEMYTLASELRAAVLQAGRKTPNLDALVGPQ